MRQGYTGVAYYQILDEYVHLLPRVEVDGAAERPEEAQQEDGFDVVVEELKLLNRYFLDLGVRVWNEETVYYLHQRLADVVVHCGCYLFEVVSKIL